MPALYRAIAAITIGAEGKGADGSRRLVKVAYAPGDILPLDPADAKRLLKLRKVKPAKDGAEETPPPRARETVRNPPRPVKMV